MEKLFIFIIKTKTNGVNRYIVPYLYGFNTHIAMKPIKKATSFCFLILFGYLSFSQSKNTLKYSDSIPPVKASLQDIFWIEGHWRGEAFDGIAEEIWSPPLGDSMMFSFKLVNENKVTFYELGIIREIQETLILQLKHFHGDMKGWEEKDETEDFKLVKIEKNKIFFDELTYEKISANEINAYVVIEQKDGTNEEMKFNYKRVQ